MNVFDRPVDRAMAEERPEKQVVRALWVNKVKAVARQHPDSEVPWYLTLSGGEGFDIELIISEGLISLTEVNSIVEKDQRKIVAVERNNRAVVNLQRKFIGLWIKQVDFGNLIRGERQFRWPEGEDIKVCRARVVNLDINSPLRARRDDGQIVFPVLEWIRKLCQIHARPPSTDWTLCLTLHGELMWPEGVNQYTRDFLSENLQREPLFAESCREFFGENLFDLVTRDDSPDFTGWDRADQQKLIMVMVPKIISRLVHNDGWRVQTEYNLRYGEMEEDQAPMVAWIIEFTWDENATATPDTLYRAALCDILSGAGEVTVNGEILKFSSGKGRP
jgi:hypothetical protein